MEQNSVKPMRIPTDINEFWVWPNMCLRTH